MASNRSTDDFVVLSESKHSRDKELNKFRGSRIGVKEIADSGITKVPDIFILPKEHRENESAAVSDCQLQVPVIDLQGFQTDRRSEIVSEILKASSTWGMFLVINHGIPQEIIQKLLECIQAFNEQPQELKMELYPSDTTKKVKYYPSVHDPSLIRSPWKDTIVCTDFDHQSTEDLDALPSICRKPMSDFAKCIIGLKDILSELLSEALGLRRDYLKTIECVKNLLFIGHYYPACPEPSLTLGVFEHSDAHFLTILVQNHINALQALYRNQWIDIEPEKGAIIVNIGDMLQLISNDKFRSAEHRVLARSIGPRVSVASFFYPSDDNKDRAYGPIKELFQGNVPPAYKETSHQDYFSFYPSKANVGFNTLPAYRK